MKSEFFIFHEWLSFVTFKDAITLFYNFQSEKWFWSLLPASANTVLENCGFKGFLPGRLDFDSTISPLSNLSWINLVYAPVTFYESTISRPLYSEPSWTFEIEIFAKIVNSLQLSFILEKSSILDNQRVSEYVPVSCQIIVECLCKIILATFAYFELQFY